MSYAVSCITGKTIISLDPNIFITDSTRKLLVPEVYFMGRMHIVYTIVSLNIVYLAKLCVYTHLIIAGDLSQYT